MEFVHRRLALVCFGMRSERRFFGISRLEKLHVILLLILRSSHLGVVEYAR
jgi:hypothetical protein